MDALKHLKGPWSSRRSGGNMTINAHDDRGLPVKVAGIVTITSTDGCTIATATDGQRYLLRN